MDKGRANPRTVKDQKLIHHNGNNGGQMIQSNLQMNSDAVQLGQFNSNDKFTANHQMVNEHQDYQAFMRQPAIPSGQQQMVHLKNRQNDLLIQDKLLMEKEQHHQLESKNRQNYGFSSNGGAKQVKEIAERNLA